MRPKVAHVAVMTKNREKMVEFYQKVFGLEPKRGFGGAIYMSDGNVNIALIEAKREDQQEGINHFGFEVDDLDDIKRRLKEAGFSSEIDSKSDKDSDHRIQDPDGHWVDMAVDRRWPKALPAAGQRFRFNVTSPPVKTFLKLVLFCAFVAPFFIGPAYSQDNQIIQAARKEGET